MEDLIKIRDYIQKLIVEIGSYRRALELKIEAKAKAISEYDRKMAIATTLLRNEDFYELDGKKYKSPPVSVTEKIAKGLCYQERYAMELAESDYKACISNIEALKAQLNGYQSIYRHLEYANNES